MALVALAGAVGVLTRYGADLLGQRSSWSPALVTLAINLIGCFCAGLIYAAVTERGVLSLTTGTVLTVGFCGGLTTFSAYALQTLVLLERTQIKTMFLYMISSPILGLVAAIGGRAFARLLFTPST